MSLLSSKGAINLGLRVAERKREYVQQLLGLPAGAALSRERKKKRGK